MNAPENYRIRLGLNIRRWRHMSKMTQTELAQRAGCSSQTVSDLERGRRDMSINMLFSLSHALGCPIKELLLGVE